MFGKRRICHHAQVHRRSFGNTGLRVSALGFGAGQIGGPELSEDEVGSLLNQVLDLGVNLFDTAPSYGQSEERIGRHLSWRRHETILSTKGGYGTEFEDWTYDAIVRGVELSLRRMRTDRLDLFHLHSCPLEILRREDILRACRDVVQSGKVRVVAYSGEEDALAFAVECGVFGGVQCSVNVCDQRSLDGAVKAAHARGLGVIAKRPLANVAWTQREIADDAAAAEYQRRFQALHLSPGEYPWDELFLRFAAHAPGVTSCVVGSRRLESIRRNVALLAKGPLPSNVFSGLRHSFLLGGRDWPGQI